jgi:hypothetical protein
MIPAQSSASRRSFSGSSIVARVLTFNPWNRSWLQCIAAGVPIFVSPERGHKVMNTKLPSGTLDKLWSDSSNWTAGIIYVCKDDPRFIVPRRMKWSGWTLNFAHPSAWVTLLLIFLSLIIPSLYLLQARLTGTVACYAYLAGIIVFWCVLSALLSSPKRYERTE